MIWKTAMYFFFLEKDKTIKSIKIEKGKVK